MSDQDSLEETNFLSQVEMKPLSDQALAHTSQRFLGEDSAIANLTINLGNRRKPCKVSNASDRFERRHIASLAETYAANHPDIEEGKGFNR